MNQNCFRMNEPDVSVEHFKNEILAVNLKNGYYHSLRDTGVPVWQLLMEGRDVETITRWLAPIYGCDPGQLASDIDSFVSELEKEELIVPQAGSTSSPSPVPSDWLGQIPPHYSKPALETYTDMQELLLLDPIHDVDATGWPNVPEPQKDAP